MRKVSLWIGLMASTALVANGCKSAAPATPSNSSANAVNSSGTRSDLISGSDPLSLNTKSPPPGPDLYVSTARVYEGTQNAEAAKAQYERALKIDPAYLPALLGYAHLLDTQREFADADTYYAKAAKRHPDVAAIYNDWGMSQQRRGKLDESAKLLAKAVHLQPNKQLYRNNLAMVLVVTHRPEEAYRELAANETPAVADFNVAALLHRAGDDRAAAYHFAQAAKEDPNWPQARQWADRLGGMNAPAVNNALAMAHDMHAPPPEPQPDPAAAQYLMASRAPIVQQASTPPAPTGAAVSTGTYPTLVAQPAMQEPAGGPTVVRPTSGDGLPAFTGVAASPVVTRTSGIAYPMQYPPAGASPAGAVVESASSAGLPPLPPSGLGLAPLPPVQ